MPACNAPLARNVTERESELHWNVPVTPPEIENAVSTDFRFIVFENVIWTIGELVELVDVGE